MQNLTTQQTAAIAAASGNRNIIMPAVAGAGKTSTIIEMVGKFNSAAICAFNRAIATEIDDKIKRLGMSHVTVGTIHSFGFGAIRRSISRVKVDGFKLDNIAKQEFYGDYEDIRAFVIKAVSMAKNIGIGACIDDNYNNWVDMIEKYDIWDTLNPKYDDNDAINAAKYLLDMSNNEKFVIDYDDMVYIPVRNKLRIWGYDAVLLDEAQDTNSTRRNLVRMMIKNGGKLIAVGDPHQAIYGFTGADSDSLDIIKKEFEAIELPLSVSFRCPKNIVNVAQKWVSHIQSAPDAPEGIVDSCNVNDIARMASADDVIICRNTKPLVELAYGLIRKGIACRVEGRSIGEGLIKLAQRWKVKSVGELSAKLTTWAENEIKKYKEKDNLSRCQVIEDQVTTLGVFIDQCDQSESVDVMIGKIRKLFGDTEGVQNVLALSTIHKAKGREWDRVFALGMDVYSPSKWAVKSWQMEQEDNLCYVQVTRAKRHLTMVNVPTKEV